MKGYEVLNRKLYYCKACKKAYSFNELIISSVWVESHMNTLVVIALCPKKHRIKRIAFSRKNDREAVIEYLESIGKPVDYWHK